MIPFAKIMGGAPSSVGGLTKHLQTQTLTPSQEWMANYYNKGGDPGQDREINALAKMVAEGDFSFERALDLLDKTTTVGEVALAQSVAHAEAWLAGRAEPDLALLAAYVASPGAEMSADDVQSRLVAELHTARGGSGLSDAARELHGLPPSKPVADYLQGLSAADLRTRQAQVGKQWAAATAHADYQSDVKAEAADQRRENLAERLGAAIERIEAGQPPAVQIGILRPDMHPIVRAGLGLDDGKALTNDRINALISGHRADTGGKIEGKRYVTTRKTANEKTGERREDGHLGSMDFAPAPHKSISVMHGFAGPVDAAKIFDGHKSAARSAMAVLAKGVGQIRLGDGGGDGRLAGHVGWIEFDHFTARRTATVIENGVVSFNVDKSQPGDPDIHTHFLLMATTFAENGKVGGIDSKAVAGLIFEADQIYHAEYAQHLRDSGFAVAFDERTGAAVATAIPDDINTLFSKRTNAGEALAKLTAKNRGEDWDMLTDEQRSVRLKNATQDAQQKQKGAKDDVADVAGWLHQAKEAGWQPPASFQAKDRAVELPHEQRIRAAYEHSLPWLDQKFQQQSVLKHYDIRVAALRGLTAVGYRGEADTAAVTKMMRDEGVLLYGQKTNLEWGQEVGLRYVGVTTTLGREAEQEFIALAKAAAADRSGSLTPKAIDKAAKESGLDFSNAHGTAQLNAIHHLGEGGRFAVVVGTAGSGKSTMLKVLTAAWKEQGRDVYGASLAWRQADAMVDGGIDRNNLKAFSVLLDGLKDGSIKLTAKSVVAVDELGLLGTRQGLELLRAREIHGFSIVGLGDSAQIQAIEAGSFIALSRRALGSEQIPEITTTVRQQTDREKEIVGLIRDNKPKAALDMKREDGTAEMVAGGYDQVIARTAQLYTERLTQTGQAPAIVVPTNADTHRVGIAIRQERHKLGLVGEDLRTVKATDGERDYNLTLAKGDHVRLFGSVGVRLATGRGGRLGRNGTVAEIVSVDDAGIVMRSLKNDLVGRVKWSDLKDTAGRVKLEYGAAFTLHTAQGSTKDEVLMVLPAGSQAMKGNMGNSGITRHRLKVHVLTSDTAERNAVRESRPLNDVRDITPDDKWAAVAKNFIIRADKDLAVSVSERWQSMKRGSLKGFHAGMTEPEKRLMAGKSPSHAPENAQVIRVEAGARLAQVAGVARQLPAQVKQQIQQAVQHVQQYVRQYHGPSIGH